MIEVKDFDTIGKPGLSREIDILFNFSFYLLKNEVGKTVDALPMCNVFIFNSIQYSWTSSLAQVNCTF